MGLLNGNNDGESENILKKVAKTGKKVWSTIMSLMILMKFIPLILVGVIVGSLLATCFSFVIDVFASENTVENIYETLEIEDMTELVEIKENSNGEYYIDFKEDTDQKLEDMIEVINSKSGTHGVPTDKDFLKELIKAELVTKFPNLGGTIPEDSSGFQGAVNLRRISPNKEIGELTSKGKGETSNIEQEEAEDPNENVGDYEAVVKSWEEGQELYTNTNAAIYKQTESELNPGSDTGNWEFVYDDQTKEKIKIEKGTQVTYTGTYKNNTNETTKVTTTYVEVKTSDRTCFVKAQNLSTKAKTSTSSNQQIASQKYAKVTSRAKTKTMGNEQEEYTIALVPAYNGENGLESGDLKEKELTKKVADKVESLFQEYSNIKIVQTEGTNGIRNADPDMAIVIYFNYGQTGTETGVDTIYKESDEISHLFADILSKSISESMGLTNLYAGEDVEKCNGTSLISIENSLSTGFPSVITRGGYLNGKTEQQLLKADGTDRYAQGIVKGIEEYINANKEGYEATEVEKETVQNSIESKVIKMKYVPLETFKKYVEENNQEALKVFTMDEQFNLLTATWNWENGKTEISENSAMDFRTMLQQYHMPYEYLLFYYTDTDYEDFSLELAKKVQETEIVMAIQDNITTTKETKITQEQKVTDPKSYQETYGESWHTTNTEETVMESVSTSIEITYVNTWCVKSYKESSYSEEILKMGDKDEIIINLKGTATSSSSSSCTSPKQIDSGTIKIPVENEVLAEDGTTQIETSYIYANYTVEEKTTTDIETYSHQYDSGESKTEGNENIFVKLYQEHKMQNRVREEWLFKILENNEKTANMVDLTKYLMFKATSENYGKVEYDFSTFDLFKFSDIDASSGLATFKEYLHSWEGHTGLSEDGTKYRVGDDGAGHPTVGYGIDIYNSGFLDRFIAAGYDVSIGSYIDKDFVDALEDEEIAEGLKTIEQKTAGLDLTIYQKYALLSRTYNCGKSGAFRERNGKTFVEAYNSFWNQETDDEYKVTANSSMYNHKLYTEYMNEPTTSGGEYMAGLENRRKSEWILFKTGYYDRIDKWCSNAEGGTIVEKAVEIHKYLRTNGYYYQQAGVTVPNTKTKTIDCSSFVTWVLIEAGVDGFESGMYQWSSAKFASNPLGWQVVSVNNAQAGDIVVYSGHVEIIAQNDSSSNKFRVYNCGGNSSINSDGGNSGLPESSTSGRIKASALKILRPPQ